MLRVEYEIADTVREPLSALLDQLAEWGRSYSPGVQRRYFSFGRIGGQGFFSRPLCAWDRLYFATSEYDRSGEWNLYSR